MSKTISKTIIFYTKAGGGHKSMALALQKELESKGDSVVLVDIFGVDRGGLFGFDFSHFFESSYNILTNRLTFFWTLLTVFWKTRWGRGLSYYFFEMFYADKIKDLLEKYKPDKVISTYYCVSEVATKIFVKSNLQTQQENIFTNATFFTVVPDLFSCSPMWFDSSLRSEYPHKYLVFSPQARQIGIDSGGKNIEQNIKSVGLVFDQKFEKKMTPQEIYDFKLANNIDPSKTLILAVGGGSGFPKAFELLKEFLKNPLDVQLVIVCGRDTNLKSKLEKLLQTNSQNLKSIQILGFTDKIHEYMNSCDAVITKSGPATVLESVSLGKPLFLIHYIWEQEMGNMQWVVNNSLGVFEPNIPKMLTKIAHWKDNYQDSNPNSKSDSNTNKIVVQNNFPTLIQEICQK
jgi:processive 1,2-diacylglycerol beta-glucosyltransferase/1,2-diacylglycerol 3-beta-galactosyltransferase